MANTKQKNSSASAAQRREQVRQQRQSGTQNKNTQTQGRRTVRKQKTSFWQSPWTLVGGILIMVAIVVGIFFFISNQSTQQTVAGNAAALKTVTSIDPKTLADVGSGSAQNLLKHTNSGTPILKGPTGKPEFFYAGAEYCPYCAAQRWAIIVALSRFGTFSPLTAIQSSENNIPTYSFHGSSYSSQYIDFVPLETTDNADKPLDVPTPAQLQILNTYNAPPYTDSSSKGSIPFISVANQYVSTGAYYSPQLFLNSTNQDIANAIKDPSTDISKNVLGAANILTAAICSSTNNQPANVCTADPIPTIQKSLGKAYSPGGTQLGAITGPVDINTRRSW